jgi:hypothetical protein
MQVMRDVTPAGIEQVNENKEFLTANLMQVPAGYKPLLTTDGDGHKSS